MNRCILENLVILLRQKVYLRKLTGSTRKTYWRGSGGDDFFQAVHVAAQGFRNDDRTVLLLIIFQDGAQCPPDGQPGAVERVDKLRLGFGLPAEPDARPPGLEIGAVGAGGDLQ